MLNSITLLKTITLFIVFFTLSQCSDNSANEISRGHRDAIKNECKDDPDKKLCGKEVRIKFKNDGHEYVTFEDLSKEQSNRVQLNCSVDKTFGLVPYNECLYKNKQLALGNKLTGPDDGEVRVASNIDKLKQYSYHILAFNEDGYDKGEVWSGTGVAIAKNLIATNCHVILDEEETLKKKRVQYLEVILVTNLLNKKKAGKVKLFKKGYDKDIDICILKTKTDLKFVEKKIRYSKLKQTDSVRALGNPKGIIGHTSQGRITALEIWEYDIVHPTINKNPIKVQIPLKMIHHDAAIGEGSSGGPLFDVGGNLVGINTQGFFEGTTGGFSVAISADHISDLLDF